MPGQLPPETRTMALLRKTVIWSFVTLLIVVVPSCVVTFSPTLRRGMFGPDYLASVTLEPEHATVSMELTVKDPIGRVEYERRLIVTAPDGSQVTDNLAQDHGGFPGANLYRTKDGKLVLADAFDAELVSLSPLGILPYRESYFGNHDTGVDRQMEPQNKQHLGDLVESNYFHGLFYVGAFRFQEARAVDGHPGLVWSFAPASEQGEFIKAPRG
jgi:hypothetical protein